MTQGTVMSTVAGRVAAGAAFLGQTDPDWWRADIEQPIDLRSLNMGYGDACVLGQRCPLETLAAYLGYVPEKEDDYDFRYHAYAASLNGGFGNRGAMEDWAVAHGFNCPFDARLSGAEYDELTTELTTEWRRVITERRAAA